MIIGEIGINHNGDLDTALKLIDVAVECGLDVVKFQKRTPTICVPEDQWDITKTTPWGVMPYIEYKQRMEFGKAEYDLIDAYCAVKGIQWTASVWDIPSLKFIMSYEVPFLKIASPTITDHKLLNKISQYDTPVIISTGMSTESEILDATDILDDQLMAILYCKSVYPSADEDINLSGIYRLREMFPDIEIGYSGHEIGWLPSLMARVMGVDTFERHITLDCNDIGTDHKISLDPVMLKDFTSELNRVDSIMGSSTINLLASEEPFRAKLRNC